MGRRRKRGPDILDVVPLFGALLLLGMFASPQSRQAIAGLIQLAIWILIAGGIGLIAYLIYRSHNPSTSSGDSNDTDLHVSIPEPPSPPIRHAESVVELVEQLRQIDWYQFEQLMALMYRKLGYSVDRRGGAKPDGGIDIVLEKDGQRTAVQCKQWKAWKVGVRNIREFVGALTDSGIQQGIFITLCGYTAEAKQLAEKHRIEILSEVGLIRLLQSTDLRYDPEALLILRNQQKYCPKCESKLVLRTATRGPNAGNEFWGCSAYPHCRFTLPKT